MFIAVLSLVQGPDQCTGHSPLSIFRVATDTLPNSRKASKSEGILSRPEGYSLPKDQSGRSHNVEPGVNVRNSRS